MLEQLLDVCEEFATQKIFVHPSKNHKKNHKKSLKITKKITKNLKKSQKMTKKISKNHKKSQKILKKIKNLGEKLEKILRTPKDRVANPSDVCTYKWALGIAFNEPDEAHEAAFRFVMWMFNLFFNKFYQRKPNDASISSLLKLKRHRYRGIKYRSNATYFIITHSQVYWFSNIKFYIRARSSVI